MRKKAMLGLGICALLMTACAGPGATASSHAEQNATQMTENQVGGTPLKLA